MTTEEAIKTMTALMELVGGRCKEAVELAISALSRDRWISVEERLPEEAGEYMVAYHPCYWNDVNTAVTKTGIDTFRGKTTWAKKKYQRVIAWRPLPEPPKEEQ